MGPTPLIQGGLLLSEGSATGVLVSVEGTVFVEYYSDATGVVLYCYDST